MFHTNIIWSITISLILLKSLKGIWRQNVLIIKCPCRPTFLRQLGLNGLKEIKLIVYSYTFSRQYVWLESVPYVLNMCTPLNWYEWARRTRIWKLCCFINKKEVRLIFVEEPQSLIFWLSCSILYNRPITLLCHVHYIFYYVFCSMDCILSFCLWAIHHAWS